MKSALLEKSERLQRVAFLMADGKRRTTFEIQKATNVCGVRDCIGEPRDPKNGFRFPKARAEGHGIYSYKLMNVKYARKRLEAIMPRRAA